MTVHERWRNIRGVRPLRRGLGDKSRLCHVPLPLPKRSRNFGLNETWNAVRSNDTFDEVPTRTAIADLTIQFAGEGERDPKRLKALVLAALPYYAQAQ
jgi:hypothetical protein